MKRIAYFFTLMLIVTASHASNFRFLENTPIAEFTPADTAMFENAIMTALEEKKDGEKLAWKNEETGVSGLVNPLSTYKKDDTTCRQIRIVNRAKNKIAESIYKFCKKDDEWVAIRLEK